MLKTTTLVSSESMNINRGNKIATLVARILGLRSLQALTDPCPKSTLSTPWDNLIISGLLTFCLIAVGTQIYLVEN